MCHDNLGPWGYKHRCIYATSGSIHSIYIATNGGKYIEMVGEVLDIVTKIAETTQDMTGRSYRTGQSVVYFLHKKTLLINY